MRRVALVGLDLAVVLAAAVLSGVLTARTVPLVFACGAAALFVIIFALFGLYRRMWRYAGVRDLLVVAQACGVAGLALLLVPGVTAELRALYWLLAAGGLSATRLGARAWRELMTPANATKTRRVLVAGAGDAGVALVRELARHSDLGLRPVGFVDDAAEKRGRRAYGLPVLGSLRDVANAARRAGAQEVVIALPSAPGHVVRSVWAEAVAARLPVRILPPLRDLSQGQRLMQQLRQVRLEDLLGRPEVRIDLGAISGYLQDKVVLVTGAGGSIGSELCRQVARVGPAQLILVGHGENSLFEIEQELRVKHPDLALQPVVGDIQDQQAVEGILGRYRPAVIFHAAAHKHVPLMERNPAEAVKNNICGTYQLAAAADQFGVERFVLISTDKAVNPSSVMGATKRAAERIVRALAVASKTVFVTVRFGNVLGSRGSVVPLFQQQIARGGPVTVTHPDATRYFMTIPEAARLVLQAGAMGQSGELFLLDMGEPVRVVDLARDLIRLAGLEPEIDVPIAYTGLRPGEKVTEELFTAEERVTATRHERIFRAAAGGGSPLNLAWAMKQFRALTTTETVSPKAILGVLDDASGGGVEVDGHDRELVRESD